MTVAQSGPILFAHCSHRFLSHGFHMVLPGRSAPFVEYLSEADAGRSRCVQSLVFLRQISSVFAPDPQVHGGADVRVRDGIPVARIGDMAVGLHPAAYTRSATS